MRNMYHILGTIELTPGTFEAVSCSTNSDWFYNKNPESDIVIKAGRLEKQSSQLLERFYLYQYSD